MAACTMSIYFKKVCDRELTLQVMVCQQKYELAAKSVTIDWLDLTCPTVLAILTDNRNNNKE